MEKKPQTKTIAINGVTVELAGTAGFCFGVQRAVDMTEALLASGKKATSLGPLIHNPQVVASLRQRGVAVADSPADVPKDTVAIIRSHGVPPAVTAALAARQVPVLDATCPFVEKIQKIAQECGEAGGTLLVAGDENHPEVEGIVGYAKGPVLVFRDLADLQRKLADFPLSGPVYVVAQTTYETAEWKQARAFLKKVYTNCVVFDTICSATGARQRETEEIARRSDLVIVIGGRGSSNTQKLYRVAAAHTKAVQVEAAAEVSGISFAGIRRIGVTAGASTPLSVIEEVLTTMSDEIREGEKSFEEMLDDSMKPVYAGQIVKGVVEAVSANEVTVDIGTKHTGIITLDELTDDPAVRSAEDVVKRDDELDLVVTKVSDQDGIVYLSRRQMEARRGAEEVSKAAEDGTVMDGYVIESNKGGLVANVKGVKVFIPASQATVRRGEDYTALVRSHVKLKIKEFSPRRTIGSIREVLAEEQNAQKEKFWSDAEAGKQYVGIVKSLTTYGAFVDIGGVDGLVHISELSWNRIKHPSEVVKVGDSIEVYIKDLDRDNQKVSLGYKKQEDNPWEQFKAQYPIGSVFTAPVVSLTQFGAFVNILPGIDGLVHISEISHDRVEKVSDALSVGQEVEVKLLDVDYERRRVSLSMKALLPEPEKPEAGGEDTLVASASEGETTVAPEMDAAIDEAEAAAKPKAAKKAKTTEAEVETAVADVETAVAGAEELAAEEVLVSMAEEVAAKEDAAAVVAEMAKEDDKVNAETAEEVAAEEAAATEEAACTLEDMDAAEAAAATAEEAVEAQETAAVAEEAIEEDAAKE